MTRLSDAIPKGSRATCRRCADRCGSAEAFRLKREGCRRYASGRRTVKCLAVRIERSPEPELRNLILIVLNANYEGAAQAEAFNGIPPPEERMVGRTVGQMRVTANRFRTAERVVPMNGCRRDVPIAGY
jgi:hypothetical protein